MSDNLQKAREALERAKGDPERTERLRKEYEDLERRKQELLTLRARLDAAGVTAGVRQATRETRELRQFLKRKKRRKWRKANG